MFYRLEVKGQGNVVEHTQAKHTKVTTVIGLWEKEKKKAVGAGDFFLLFTTHNTKITANLLPPRGGIVSSAVFGKYFGPYAARAFQAVHVKRKRHINECSYEQLQETHGVGPTKVLPPPPFLIHVHKHSLLTCIFTGKENHGCP
jgi:hypothetical protein